ncbi:MAG: S41 family peptidase [Bacteroidales bacterium]
MHINDLYSSNFSKSMEALAKSKKIIIDFRGYPNDNSVTFGLWNTLLPPVNFFYAAYADTRKPGTFRKCAGYSVGRDNILKDKQAIVLVSANTQSLSEHVVMALQQHPNVQTIGTLTAGTNGNVVDYVFPGNIPIIFTGIGIRYMDDTDMQQVGVRIDKIIEPTISDIQSEEDYLIREAKKMLKYYF